MALLEHTIAAAPLVVQELACEHCRRYRKRSCVEQCRFQHRHRSFGPATTHQPISPGAQSQSVSPLSRSHSALAFKHSLDLSLPGPTHSLFFRPSTIWSSLINRPAQQKGRSRNRFHKMDNTDAPLLALPADALHTILSFVSPTALARVEICCAGLRK